MNDRNFVKTKDGQSARNKYGSCGVLAIAAIKGMRYEDATAWTIKNNMAAKVKNGEVAGMDIMKGGGFSTFKKLGAKKVVRYYPKGWKASNNAEALAAEAASDNKYLAKIGGDGIAYNRCKVETFAKRNPRGRFMLVTKNHALACIHGEIYHNGGKWNFINQLVDFSVQF